MTEINPTHVAEVVATLMPLHVRALDELDTFYGRGPGHLVSALNISRAEAKAIFAHFRQQGICNYGPLMSEDDGAVQGAGYWLDTFGQAVKAAVPAELIREAYGS